MVYFDVPVAKLAILGSIPKRTGLAHRSVVVFRRLDLLDASVNKPLVAESMSASAGTEEDLGTLGYCLRGWSLTR
jgi:hypothetical protein